MKNEIGINDFEGPLDLLLKLISEQKIDILDIPIAKITDQYNQIINSWSKFDLEEASDYLVMAARLLQIKAQMLLPRKKEIEIEQDPREELAKQLLEYSIYQKVAKYLGVREEDSSYLLEKEPEYIPGIVKEVPARILPSTLARAMRKIIANKEVRGKTNLIYAERFSIEECKNIIKEKLVVDEINFRDCFSKHSSKDEIITIFLALLELYKVNFLNFVQQNGEIYITRRECSSLG